MLRKIKLYGELAEFVGNKEFEVQVTGAELRNTVTIEELYNLVVSK